MIVLFCIFSDLFVFFTVYYALVNIRKMEIAGKVYNAVEKKENKSFIMPVIMYNAEKLGRLIACGKYGKFAAKVGKIGIILKSLGGRYEELILINFLRFNCF